MLRIILGGPDYDSLQRGSDVGAGTYVFLVTKSSGLEEIEGPTASTTARVLVSFLMSCPPPHRSPPVTPVNFLDNISGLFLFQASEESPLVFVLLPSYAKSYLNAQSFQSELFAQGGIQGFP